MMREPPIPDKRLSLLTSRRRWLLRLGLSAMLVLMGVSAFLAYEIQQDVSEDAEETYQAHIQRDEALQRVRGVLWQSSILVRDFLLSTAPDREAAFTASLDAYRSDVWSAQSPRLIEARYPARISRA